jgi:hypothetical protein
MIDPISALLDGPKLTGESNNTEAIGFCVSERDLRIKFSVAF